MLEFFPMPVKGQFIFTFDLKENYGSNLGSLTFLLKKKNLALKYFQNMNGVLYFNIVL